MPWWGWLIAPSISVVILVVKYAVVYSNNKKNNKYRNSEN